MSEYKCEEVIARLRECHDDFKNHPYFINFDEVHFKSFYQMFYKLADLYFDWRHRCIDRIVDSTPQESIIRKIWHDLSASMWPERFKKNVGKNVAQVEIFLMIIHQIINGEFDKCNVRNPYDWYGYEAVRNNDGSWRTVLTCYEKDREKCIRVEEHWLEYSQKHNYEEACRKIEQQIEELRSGKTLTDGYKIYNL